MDFDDHGYFNLQFFIIIFFVILIILSPLNWLIYFTKLKSKKYKIIYLNNTYIENNVNKYGCQIVFPKECTYKIRKYFLDFNKLKGLNCSNSIKFIFKTRIIKKIIRIIKISLYR